MTSATWEACAPVFPPVLWVLLPHLQSEQFGEICDFQTVLRRLRASWRYFTHSTTTIKFP